MPSDKAIKQYVRQQKNQPSHYWEEDLRNHFKGRWDASAWGYRRPPKRDQLWANWLSVGVLTHQDVIDLEGL